MTEIVHPLYLWVDSETTGLDKVHDPIFQIAWQVTDHLGATLTPLRHALVGDLAKALSRLTIFHGSRYALGMHADSGLLATLGRAVARGDVGETATGVRDWIMATVAECLEEFGEMGPIPEVILAGSSIHFDKERMETQLGFQFGSPGVLSHRLMDVSQLYGVVRTLGLAYDEPSEAEIGNRTEEEAGEGAMLPHTAPYDLVRSRLIFTGIMDRLDSLVRH